MTLKVVIENGTVLTFTDEHENSCRVVFNRTLRLPMDDKVYPLPPSLGQFPILKVEDYKDKVPEEWAKHGGVFIPMYQREAMWLGFSLSRGDYPFALKIATGKVNSVSGETWTEIIDPSAEQDYCVMGTQPWLDGINAGNGFIKQFVSMPKGSGHSIEQQVTGEDKVGGVQFLCFAPKPEKISPIRPIPRVEEMTYSGIPAECDAEFGAADVPMGMCEEKVDFFSPSMMGGCPPPAPPKPCSQSCPPPAPQAKFCCAPPPQAMDDCPQPSAMCSTTSISASESKQLFAPQAQMASFASLSSKMESYSSNESLDFKESEECADDGESEGDCEEREQFVDEDRAVVAEELEQEHREEIKFEKKKKEVTEMTISAGGKMVQEISKDPHGPETWDNENKVRCFVHFVNAEVYEDITGTKPPPCPIDANTYSEHGYPWYTYYDETNPAVPKSNILEGVKSVAEIDIEKTGETPHINESFQIDESQMVHYVKK